MLLRFDYTNWRGHDHTYVIDPAAGRNPGLHAMVDAERADYWGISGQVITRDGDPRREMGDNRRRTFALVKMRNVEEVHPHELMGP